MIMISTPGRTLPLSRSWSTIWSELTSRSGSTENWRVARRGGTPSWRWFDDATCFSLPLIPTSSSSRACRSELDYGARLGKVVLPVMVKDVAVQLAPPVIANSQIVDYRSRSIESAIALVSAVNNLPQSPPLPNPLPGPPKPPISYMSSFSEQIDADSLTYRDQIHLVAEAQGVPQPHLRPGGGGSIAAPVTRPTRHHREGRTRHR